MNKPQIADAPTYVKRPHKHAEVIKAWADGAEIEIYSSGIWQTVSSPLWLAEGQYRVKPTPHQSQTHV